MRIALALKGLDYEYVPVHLVKNEQLQAPFSDMAPARLVPLLKDGDRLLSQSLAIIEYLEYWNVDPRAAYTKGHPTTSVWFHVTNRAEMGAVHGLNPGTHPCCASG